MIAYRAQFLLDKEKGKDTAKLRYRVKWDNNTKIVAFSVGYRVNVEKWSIEVQRCKNNTTHGKRKVSASIINKKLQKYENACDDLFAGYSYENKMPDKETFKNDFNIKIGKVEEVKKKDKTFFDFFDDFILETASINQWTKITKNRFLKLKEHLMNFDEDLTFEELDENKLVEYQYYLQNKMKFRAPTINKHFSNLKRFLRWTTKKEINSNKAYEYFKPKLKNTQKKVIFLTQEELEQVKNYNIPEQKKYLDRIRDVFLFQCFTGLRYSDVQNLKKTDIKDNHIEVTVLKTTDSLIIELNLHSKAILDKYANEEYENNKALPVISNAKANDYLKELMELAGINELIRETYYIGNKRIDQVVPKYSLISTHAGRRTFICTALSLGISPQVVMKWTGHSDYKSMKPYIDIADKIKGKAMEKFNMI